MQIQYTDKEKIDNILKEINDYKAKYSSGEIEFLDQKKCYSLAINLFKEFYGTKVNEGILAVIFRNNFLIGFEIIDQFFKNPIPLKYEKIAGQDFIIFDKYEPHDNGTFLYKGYSYNNVFIKNNDIKLEFTYNELKIIFKSKIGEHRRITILVDEDGLVSQREIKQEFPSRKINTIPGYECRNIITIKRDKDDPRFITVSDAVEVAQGLKLYKMPINETSGYINPTFTFDLAGISILEQNPTTDNIDLIPCFVKGELIDEYFPNIKNAFEKRLKKQKVRSLNKRSK